MTFEAAKYLIESVLIPKGLYCFVTAQLMLGTLAVESDFGETRRHPGDALGIYSIERPTFEYLQFRYKNEYDLQRYVFADLEHDDELSVLIARLKYLSTMRKMPKKNNTRILADIWKGKYNTKKGKGKVGDYMRKYKKYVRTGMLSELKVVNTE